MTVPHRRIIKHTDREAANMDPWAEEEDNSCPCGGCADMAAAEEQD